MNMQTVEGLRPQLFLFGNFASMEFRKAGKFSSLASYFPAILFSAVSIIFFTILPPILPASLEEMSPL